MTSVMPHKAKKNAGFSPCRALVAHLNHAAPKLTTRMPDAPSFRRRIAEGRETPNLKRPRSSDASPLLNAEVGEHFRLGLVHGKQVVARRAILRNALSVLG